jgi:hypothetical protein
MIVLTAVAIVRRLSHSCGKELLFTLATLVHYRHRRDSIVDHWFWVTINHSSLVDRHTASKLVCPIWRAFTLLSNSFDHWYRGENIWPTGIES